MVEQGSRPMNNFSIFTADRGTHVKIVVVSLIASIIVMAVGVTARTSTDTASVQASNVIVKATKPVMATTTGAGTVR
jgi:ABC-type proline/glycine betaine transport system permease subunit